MYLYGQATLRACSMMSGFASPVTCTVQSDWTLHTILGGEQYPHDPPGLYEKFASWIETWETGLTMATSTSLLRSLLV